MRAARYVSGTGVHLDSVWLGRSVHHRHEIGRVAKKIKL